MFIIIGIQVLLLVWLVRYLVRGDRGPKEPFGALLYAGVLGLFAAIIGSFLESLIIPAGALPTLHNQTTSISATGLVLACLAVGIIEEGCKALPLKGHIYKKPYFNEVSDGVIYFGIAG